MYDSAKGLIAAAGQVAGWEFNKDPNDGYMLGISWAQTNQGVRLYKKNPLSTDTNTAVSSQHGKRSTGATGYLHEGSYTSRPNLDVLLHTTVTKLNMAPRFGGKYIVRGVELKQWPQG